MLSLGGLEWFSGVLAYWSHLRKPFLDIPDDYIINPMSNSAACLENLIIKSNTFLRRHFSHLA